MYKVCMTFYVYEMLWCNLYFQNYFKCLYVIYCILWYILVMSKNVSSKCWSKNDTRGLTCVILWIWLIKNGERLWLVGYYVILATKFRHLVIICC